jgi:hypothetical protein
MEVERGMGQALHGKGGLAEQAAGSEGHDGLLAVIDV